MATRHLQRPGHPSSVLLLPMVIKAFTVVINYGLAAPGARAVGKPGLGLIDKSALDRKASSRPLLLGQAVLPQDHHWLALWVVTTRGIGDSSNLLVNSFKGGKTA